MKIKYLTICSLTAIGLSLSACDVEKTQEGEMPEIDVEATEGQLPKYDVDITKTQEGEMPEIHMDAEPGQLPNYDVDTADVDIGTKEVQVEVPDVDVEMKEKTITVPDVDVTMPDDSDDDTAEG